MATSTIPASAPYPIFRGSRIIEFVERAVPPAGPGQLLIQCKANALCASDLGQYFNGATIAPGHEATGIVAAAGPGTTTSEGFGWFGKRRSAVAIASAVRGPSPSSMPVRPRSAARLARIYCSMRGLVRGIMIARLSNDRISQKIL